MVEKTVRHPPLDEADTMTPTPRPAASVAALLALLALLAAVSPATASDDGPDPATPPNVVLIISDDHAWTDYGFAGHPHLRTPNLDRLAAESLTFDRGYVPSSLCCPSLATIITGLYPHQHGVTCNDPPRPEGVSPKDFRASAAFDRGREAMCRMLEAVPTLPRMLGERGYLSLQTGKWWQGDYSRGGFTHGMTRGDRHGDIGLAIGREGLEPIDEFLDLARDDDRPFLLWYAPMMPHQPHNPPDRLLEHYRNVAPSESVARYWAMVEWFDETCGDLLETLERRGLAEDTIVLYLADNGWVQDPDGPSFIRSKRTPYDAGLRTPIMVRWPGVVAPDRREELVSSIDLAPTILRAVGLEPTGAMPGVDLLDPRAVASRPSIFGACYNHDAIDLDDPASNLRERWMIAGDWKLIAPTPLSDLDSPELYDLADDPDERRDLAGARPDRVSAMLGALDAWWDPSEP